MSEKSISHKVVDEFIEGLKRKETLKEATLETFKEYLYSGQANKEDIIKIISKDLKNENS